MFCFFHNINGYITNIAYISNRYVSLEEDMYGLNLLEMPVKRKTKQKYFVRKETHTNTKSLTKMSELFERKKKKM